MRGFLYKTVRQSTQVVDETDGLTATVTKDIPRDIADLKDDKIWSDPEYFVKTFKPVVGPAIVTPNGHVRRSFFFAGSSGPKGNDGRPYRRLRVGQIIQGQSDPDPETGESDSWTMIVLEGEREVARSRQVKAAPAAQQETEDTSDAAEVAEEVKGL